DAEHTQQLHLRHLPADWCDKGQVVEQILRLVTRPHDGNQTRQDQQGAGGKERGIAFQIADQTGVRDALLTQQQAAHPVLAVQVQYASQARRIPPPMPGVTVIADPAEHEPAYRRQVQPQRFSARQFAHCFPLPLHQACCGPACRTRSTIKATTSMMIAGTNQPSPWEVKGKELSQATSRSMKPAAFNPSMIPKTNATSMTGRMMGCGRCQRGRTRPRRPSPIARGDSPPRTGTEI